MLLTGGPRRSIFSILFLFVPCESVKRGSRSWENGGRRERNGMGGRGDIVVSQRATMYMQPSPQAAATMMVFLCVGSTPRM